MNTISLLSGTLCRKVKSFLQGGGEITHVGRLGNNTWQIFPRRHLAFNQTPSTGVGKENKSTDYFYWESKFGMNT